MKNKLIALSLFLNLLLILAACSGGMKRVPSVPRLHAFVGATPGFHGLSAKQTTAFKFSIVPELRAQTSTTVSFAGSYSGFCSAIPAPPGAGVWAIALYGSGSLDTSSCGEFSQNTDAGLAAATNAQSGQLVIGNGTLGPLVAYADSSSSTVRVFVKRNGQVLDSGLSVTLSGNTRGTSTSTFAVEDGDLIVVTAESNGTPSTNLQFVLAKQ